MKTSSDLTSSQKWELLACVSVCLHSQISATHWISFSPSGLSFFTAVSFLVVCFDLPNIFTGQSHACSESLFTLSVGWKRANWMLANNNNNKLSPLFLFLNNPKKKMQKCCECMIESVTCRTAHFWQFCLPKEYNCIEERREICCIVYKVMFIQYFNITSDFRGRYLNRILYLHVKCQQQFIDIVLPFIIRVLIVFLIFV